MCKNNWLYVLYVVELCSYIITNVSNNVQTVEICNFNEGNVTFHQRVYLDMGSDHVGVGGTSPLQLLKNMKLSPQ